MTLEYNTAQYTQISVSWDAVNTKEEMTCQVFHYWCMWFKYTTNTITLRHYFNLPEDNIWRVNYTFKRDHLLLSASDLTLIKSFGFVRLTAWLQNDAECRQ